MGVWTALILPCGIDPDGDPEPLVFDADCHEQAEVEAEYNARDGAVVWLEPTDDPVAALAAYREQR